MKQPIKIKILTFGIVHDIVGKRDFYMKVEHESTIQKVFDELVKNYSELTKIKFLSFAVNEEYQPSYFVLENNDCLALIPPVSGG